MMAQESGRTSGVGGERLLSVAHVARRLGVSTKTVRRKISAGEFPRWQKLWGMVRVPEGDVQAVVDRERKAAARG
jgi:excisionase family DNA binding protein